jgi:hypothetical protein
MVGYTDDHRVVRTSEVAAADLALTNEFTDNSNALTDVA